MTTPNLNELDHLNARGWEKARENAEKIIRARLKEPTREAYFSIEDKPSNVDRAISGLLVLVAVASFGVSAAKEIAALDLVLSPLPTISERISASYVSLLLLACLSLSEAGVLLFGLAIKPSMARTARYTYRFFQWLCMSIALVANATITALHPIASAWVFDLLLTFAPPLVVIGVGLVLEERAKSVNARKDSAQAAYDAALTVYRRVNENPELDDDFMRVWGQAIVEAMVARSLKNKELLPAWLDEHPEIAAQVAQREYNRYQWIFQPVSQPEMPKQVEQPKAVSIVSGGTAETARERAVKLLSETPELMQLSLTQLVEKHPEISRSTWNRAKQDVKEVQS